MKEKKTQRFMRVDYCDIIQNLYISSTSQTPSGEESHGMCGNGTLS